MHTAVLLEWLLLTGCPRSEPIDGQSEVSQMTPEPPWQAIYDDGSGNRYRFWRSSSTESAHFDFDPQQPLTSSSGIYSGGSPNSGELTPTQAADLWSNMVGFERNTAIHFERREKGTGRFLLTRGGVDQEFIIARGTELDGFGDSLAAFRKE